MQDFRNLTVWQRSHELTLAVYRITSCFPKDEMYGLTGQMRRCCASIPTNLAEGCGRGSDADFARFVQMAMGLASELEYHCLLARDLALIDGDRYEPLAHTVTEIKRMLTMLLKRLRTDR